MLFLSVVEYNEQRRCEFRPARGEMMGFNMIDMIEEPLSQKCYTLSLWYGAQLHPRSASSEPPKASRCGPHEASRQSSAHARRHSALTPRPYTLTLKLSFAPAGWLETIFSKLPYFHPPRLMAGLGHRP
jgi:hypothetical protein